MYASEQAKNQKYEWSCLIGIMDMLILSRANFVVGTFSSNFARLVFELMHSIDPDPFYRFKSLDVPYFIYGFNENILTKNNVL